MVVNYTYGVLTCGLVKKESPWFRGHFNVNPTDSQLRAMNKLINGLTPDAVGQLTDTLIHIIQCSEIYPKYIHEYDPVNTYHIELVVPPEKTLVSPVTYERLLSWADETTIINSKYVNNNAQDDVQRIVNCLYGVLTDNDKR